MKPTPESVMTDVMQLSRDEQMDVAQRIEASLEDGFWADDETRQAWIEESERRVEAVRRGEMKLHDGDQVIRDLESGLIP